MKLRERINGDPKLQLGLGAIFLLLVVFVLMNKGGGEETEAVTEEPAAASVEGAVEPGLGVEGATEATGGEASLASLGENVSASPLPKEVTAAYDANKTVAVLFVHNGGVDDRLVRFYGKSLSRYLPASKDFEAPYKLFVVPLEQIGRYSALTFGMEVQRVPALIVLRRKSLSKGGAEASILYGYQAPARIALTLRRASYKGPTGAYHPG